MRVLVVLGPSEGGIGRHVQDLARALPELGHEVRLAGPADTLRAHGLRGAGWTSERAAPLLLRRAARGCDVVHAHGVRAALLVRAGAVRSAAPVVLTWHNPPAGPRLLHKLVARGACVNLCVSADLVDLVRRLGAPAELLAVPAGERPVGPGGRRRVRAALGLAAGVPLVLAVARLDRQKGLDVLVDAAPAVAARLGVPVTVAVAGAGPLHGPLAARAARAGTDLRLLGHRDDVGDLLAAADVVVLPSRWEGSSLLAQEALRAGRPLVATDVGGTRALVGDAALLVLPGSASQLAEAVATVLSSGPCRERLAAAAADRVRQWPEPAAALAEVVQVLERAARSSS